MNYKDDLINQCLRIARQKAKIKRLTDKGQPTGWDYDTLDELETDLLNMIEADKLLEILDV